MSNYIVSDSAAWAARAAAARAAGVELEELSAALGNVVSSNYFGLGCEEGAALFSSLRSLIKGGTDSLTKCSRGANSLASSTAASAREMNMADGEGAQHFSGRG